MRLVLVTVLALVFAGFALAESVAVESSIPNGATISGCPKWSVAVTPYSAVAGVRFMVDGRPIYQDLLNPAVATAPISSDGSSAVYQIPPAGYIGKGRIGSTGRHLLSAVAVDADGVELGRSDSNVTLKTGNHNCAIWATG